MIKVNNPSPKKLISILSKNPLRHESILHYTGTMWGVGARLSAIDTIKRINELKQRDAAGMIVLVPNIMWFEEQEIPIPDKIYSLMQQYFPGNLSIAFPVDDPRFEHVAMNGKVAFRVPQDPLLRLFIELLDEPIVSTSINYSNLPAENDVARLERIFGSWFDFALYPPKRVIQDGATASTIVEYFGKKEGGIEDLKCLREGSVPFYEVKNSFFQPLVMFVCTANICRSPIAEKLFAKLIREQNMGLDTDSSGLLEGGHMISLFSMQLLMQNGMMEAQEHVSKKITPEMVSKSWLVITMEERQRNFLREANPQISHKILTLNEITGFSGDVEDPHGSSLEAYRLTYALIEERLNILIKMIKNDEIKLFKDKQ